jgi:hypothetical protein
MVYLSRNAGNKKGPKLRSFALAAVQWMQRSAGGPRPVPTGIEEVSVDETVTTREATGTGVTTHAAAAGTSVAAGEQNVIGDMAPP